MFDLAFASFRFRIKIDQGFCNVFRRYLAPQSLRDYGTSFKVGCTISFSRCKLADARAFKSLRDRRSRCGENSVIFDDISRHLRRRRDLNPRAAINDLLPFQGSPFNLLGTSPKKLKNYFTICIELGSSTERVGFEPTRPCGQTVFKTASL